MAYAVSLAKRCIFVRVMLAWWGSMILLRIGGVEQETLSAMRNSDVIGGFGALLGSASAIAILVAIGQISRRQDQAQTA